MCEVIYVCPLPANEVRKIVQLIRKGEGRKERIGWDPIFHHLERMAYCP
jgi:hypothetical protein